MAFTDIFEKMGYVPQGARPKHVDSSGQVIPDPGDFSERLLKGIMEYKQKVQVEEKKRQELFKNQSDQYKTLRESGYSPEKAFKAVSGQKLTEPGGTDELDTTAAGKFRSLVKQARAGTVPWQDVKNKYPDKLDKIEKIERASSPEIKRSPQFKMGTGGLISRGRSFFRKTQAELTPTTLKVIEQIETEADLKELLERKEEAIGMGIDVKAILEYFGVSEEDLK